MVEVPSKDSATDAGKTGIVGGGMSGLGQALGRSTLGPGIGTAAGGIAAASAMEGDSRDRAAERAVDRAVIELFGGQAQVRNSGGSSRGRM